jgi:MYXO-CTERM domain-containing protein
MNPRPRWVDRMRQPTRWLIVVATLVVAPKCFLCLAAYAGVATGLGLGAQEICGVEVTPSPVAPGLGLLGLALAATALLVRRPDHR